MTNEEFYEILNSLGDYLEMKKDFVANPPRYAEFEDAVRKAREVFPEAKIEIQNDPLEMGAMILQIEDFDLDICKGNQIDRFIDIIHKADNCEFYALPNKNVRIAVVYQNALLRVLASE